MKKIVVGGLNGKMGSFLVEALKNDEKEISCKEKDSFADRGYCMADFRI